MSINQRITNKDSIFKMLKNHFLFQHHSAHTVNRCRYFIAIECLDILVAFRTKIIALIFMKAEVKSRTMLYNRTIK